MPSVFLSPFGNGAQLLDDNGVPLAGGFVNTYAAGTTTPTATYTSSSGTIQNANPIALNSAGRITTEVWIPQGIAVKFVPVSSVSQAVGTQLDNVYGINDPTTINGLGYTGATVSGALIMNAAPINEAQGANIPVASAINLTTASGNYLSLTGTGTVTAIQLSQGAYRELVVNTVSAAFVNSTTLALLGGTNITPAVGDIIGFRGEGTQGVVRNVLYQPASGIPGSYAVTANTVLAGPTVSSAPVAKPTFRALNGFDGAGWVLLSSGAAVSNATFDFKNGIDATYDHYAILLSNVSPATNTQALQLTISEDGGATFKANGYGFASFNWNDAAASGAGGSTSAANIQVINSQANSVGQGAAGVITFDQPANVSYFKIFSCNIGYVTASSNFTQFMAAGSYKVDGNAINAVRLAYASGNIATGNFALYGIRKG